MKPSRILMMHLGKADPNAHYSAFNEHFTVLDILCMKGNCLEHYGHSGQAQETGEKNTGTGA